MKIGKHINNHEFEDTKIYRSVNKSLFRVLNIEDWDDLDNNVTKTACQYVGRALTNIMFEKNETWF
jgi:hypothetical protein